MHLPSPGSHAQGRGTSPLLHARSHAADALRRQTKSAELFNNFVSGAIGGFVGTALNTPCTRLTLALASRSLIPSLCSRRGQISRSELG